MHELHWQQHARLQAEFLQLQREAFRLACSIQVMEAERNLATCEQLTALNRTILRQQQELEEEISRQLIALKELEEYER